MEQKRPQAEVGVIVGRFQTHKLHESHIDLINTVVKNHEHVLIFLGLSALKATWNNPLDFETRRVMIAEQFPDVTVLYIKDQPTDEGWSKNLDAMIKDNISPHHSAVLYGGRDSFISHYKGKYPTLELESDVIQSASVIRNQLSAKIRNTEDFRAGVIWATQHMYPSVKATVDIAILNENETKILVGKRNTESKFRIVGGFSDPVLDNSFEDSAKRETREETALEVSEPKYIGSVKIDDWRYRNEKDKVFTLFFKCKRVFGQPQANDDIAEVRWMSIDKTSMADIVDEHKVLMEMLIDNVLNDILPDMDM